MYLNCCCHFCRTSGWCCMRLTVFVMRSSKSSADASLRIRSYTGNIWAAALVVGLFAEPPYSLAPIISFFALLIRPDIVLGGKLFSSIISCLLACLIALRRSLSSKITKLFASPICSPSCRSKRTQILWNVPIQGIKLRLSAL